MRLVVAHPGFGNMLQNNFEGLSERPVTQIGAVVTVRCSTVA
jgi:hypothetical protein